MKQIFLMLLCSNISLLAIAQTEIYGTVNDSINSEPIPYVNIYLKGSEIGTYSGESGEFRLVVDQWTNQDTLVFSCVGYQQKEIAYQALSDVIVLRPATFVLEETIVQSEKIKLEAKEIVKQAIENIEYHYDFNSKVKGFYRQIHYYIPYEFQKKNKYYSQSLKNDQKKYLRSIEAFLNVDRKTQQGGITYLRRSDDFRVYDYGHVGEGRRFSMNYVRNTDEIDKVIERERSQYNLSTFLSFDPLWSSKLPVEDQSRDVSSVSYGNLNSEFIKRHKFKLDSVTQLNGQNVFVIKILPSSKSYKFGFFKKHSWIPIGRLYINGEDFSIVKMEYRYIVNPKEKGYRGFALRTSLAGNTLFSDVFIYKKNSEGKSYLSYAKRIQRDEDAKHGEINSKGGQVGIHRVEREFLACEGCQTNTKSTIQDLYSPYQYDPSFWKKNNSIYLEASGEQKLRSDLESSGTTLEDQYLKNGAQR